MDIDTTLFSSLPRCDGAGSVTLPKPFGQTDGFERPMFNVCAGVQAGDALVHASHLLKCAYATAYELTDNGDGDTGLVWAALELMSSARALVDAVAEGMSVQGN